MEGGREGWKEGEPSYPFPFLPLSLTSYCPLHPHLSFPVRLSGVLVISEKVRRQVMEGGEGVTEGRRQVKVGEEGMKEEREREGRREEGKAVRD